VIRVILVESGIDPAKRTARMRLAAKLLSKKLKAKHPDVDDLVLSGRGPRKLSVDLVSVAKQHRSAGTGSKVMQAISAFADRHKSDVSLELATPADMMGTSSSGRLKKFYARFGFKPSGTSTDFGVTRKVMTRKSNDSRK